MSGEDLIPRGEEIIDNLSSPLIINWSLSFRCNFDCRHCYSRLDQSSELGIDEVKEIARKLASAGVMFVNFGGGEPLLRKDLYNVAGYAAGLGMRVSMNSNGYLVDGGMARRLKEVPFNSVGISIDSHNPGTHDLFRNREGSHRRAVEAVRNLKQAGLTVSISTVICLLNHESLEPLMEMAASLGVSRLFLHNFKCSGKGLANRFELDLSPQQWKDFYERALTLTEEEPPVPISFDDPIIYSLNGSEPGGPVRGSTCGKISLNIRPNGDITPCGFIPLVIGNALNDDLLDIWENSEVLTKMRQKLPKGKCQSCPSYVNCLGGCTARAFSVTGDFEEPDPHCWRS